MSYTSTEIPQYQCHKKVWALKIAAIEFNEDGSAKIAPKDEGFEVFTTEPGYRLKFHADPCDENDLGYYVSYDSGYHSWSPSKAFEEGYTKIGS